MLGFGSATRVYVAIGATDMRKGFEGLFGIARSALPKMISLRCVLAGVGFQDPQHFCDRLGVLMRAVTRRDDAFALRAVHV
jgi:hypothetical protein